MKFEYSLKIELMKKNTSKLSYIYDFHTLIIHYSAVLNYHNFMSFILRAFDSFALTKTHKGI